MEEMPQFFLLGGSVFIFLFYAFNIPAQSSVSTLYAIMSFVSMVIIISSKLINFKTIKGKPAPYDPVAPLHGDNVLDPSGNIKKYYGWIALALFVMTFVIFTVKIEYSVAAPDFQILDLGLLGDLVLKGMAGLTENFFFFISLNIVLSSLFGYYSRNTMVSEILSWAGCVGAFMSFHVLRYGLEQFSVTFMLAIFGLEMLFWIKIFGEPNFAHIRHFTNNVMKGIMDKYGLSVFFVQVMVNPVFWIIVMVVALVAFTRYRSSRKGKGKGLEFGAGLEGMKFR